jgi:hypothetical protein
MTKFSSPFMAKSPLALVDDALKNADVSDLNFETLSKMRDGLSKDKDPNDYHKVTKAMIDQRNKVFETNPELAKTMIITPREN